MLSHTDLAWAAGFFDGEGCTTVGERLYKNVIKSDTLYKYPRLKIGQSCDLYLFGEACSTLLEKFQHIFPVKSNLIYDKKIAYNRRHIVGQLYFEGFERVQFVIAAMWPWLGQPKKDQYIECIRRLA